MFFLLLMLHILSIKAQNVKISAEVDERTELLSTVFRLAEAREYSENNFPLYIDRVNAHFKKFKGHKVVSYSQIMRKKHGVAYDAVMSMAIHLKIENGVISLMDDIEKENMDDRWTAKSIPIFIELLNDFYKETDFHAFFEEQKEIRELTELRFRDVLDQVDFKWFEEFFGEEPDENFNIIISLLNGAHYGPNVDFINKRREIFSIISVSNIDSLGMPFFADWTVNTIIHEFCHSFCNKLIDKNYAEMEKKAKEFFELKKSRMQWMSYGEPKIMLYELLVRACVIKYEEYHGKEEKKIIQNIRGEKRLGFMWVDKLFFKLKEYEENRSKYPTLESFMPEIVKFQNALDPQEILKEQQEERSNTTIQIIGLENHAQNVDPELTQIIVRFDSPMTTGVNGISEGKLRNFKKYGLPVTNSYWNEETKNEWIIEVKLEPDTKYSVSFPYRFFLTEDVLPLKETYYLDFKTRK